MTVLARELPIGAAAWTDLTDGMDLADGLGDAEVSWWELEGQLMDVGEIGWLLTVTDNTTPPGDDAPATLLYSRSAGSDANRKTIRQTATQHWWARASYGDMQIVALPTYARG